MFGIGAQELVVIMVLALLVFGPKRLPELARSLGRGMAEFRRASNDLRNNLSAEDDDDATTKPKIAPPPTTADAPGPAQAVGEQPAAPPEAAEAPVAVAANDKRGTEPSGG